MCKIGFNLKEKVVWSPSFICPGHLSFNIIKFQAIKTNIIQRQSPEIGMGRVFQEVRADFRYTIHTPCIYEEWRSFSLESITPYISTK